MQIEAQKYAASAANYQSCNDLSNAEKSIRQALKIDSNNAEYLHFLGLIKYQQQNTTEAIQLLSSALNKNNRDPVFHYNLGVILKSTNQLEEALKHQKSALKLDPRNTHYMNEISLIYIELGKLKQARKFIFKSFSLDKKNSVTNSYFSYLLRKENNPSEAIKFAKKTLSLDPKSSTAYMNMGQALVMANQIEDGIFYIKKSFDFGNDHLLASQQSALLYLLYITNYSPMDIFDKHKSFCQNLLPTAKNIPDKHLINFNKEPLSIGFISSDFRFHSVFHFFIALVKNYNKENFNFYCYSGVSKPDAGTESIKNQVDHWREVHNKSTMEITKQIKSDNIDILIDLSGHTKGNYLPVFTQRPAPVQMTFLGYPFSTGLEAMDYKITDEFSDPSGLTEKLHTEKLLRLSPSFLCYTPYLDNFISESIPVEKNTYITFGSFNKFSKLSTEILTTWSKILLTVENSKLVLKNNQPLSDLLCNNILSVFTSNGIDKNRIVLKNPTSTTDSHMHHYNGIDICLDTYPYNGTTTTFEALWMGVPVITLTGEDHRSRVGNSILSTLRHKELISHSDVEYIRIAESLANNIETIKLYRKSLRIDLQNSDLMNGKCYTEKFEHLLKDAWKNQTTDT